MFWKRRIQFGYKTSWTGQWNIDSNIRRNIFRWVGQASRRNVSLLQRLKNCCRRTEAKAGKTERESEKETEWRGSVSAWGRGGGMETQRTSTLMIELFKSEARELVPKHSIPCDKTLSMCFFSVGFILYARDSLKILMAIWEKFVRHFLWLCKEKFVERYVMQNNCLFAKSAGWWTLFFVACAPR